MLWTASREKKKKTRCSCEFLHAVFYSQQARMESTIRASSEIILKMAGFLLAWVPASLVREDHFIDWPVHLSSAYRNQKKLLLSLSPYMCLSLCIKHLAYSNRFTWAVVWDLKLWIFWSNAFIHFSSLAVGDRSAVVQHAEVSGEKQQSSWVMRM